jgi:hypothetical protein
LVAVPAHTRSSFLPSQKRPAGQALQEVPFASTYMSGAGAFAVGARAMHGRHALGDDWPGSTLKPGRGASAQDLQVSERFAATAEDHVPAGHGVQAAAPAASL